MQFDESLTPGRCVPLAPGLTRITANNPSPMTGPGTNTYLIGDTNLALIDPGPNDPAHAATILSALRPGQRISHIIVTHSHLDHSPLAAPLSAQSAAPIYAFGDSNAGRSRVMQQLTDQGFIGGGEGVDPTFAPDYILADNDTLTSDEWSLTALHTPGHFGNHICLRWNDVIFCGDHVMGWSTSLVSPPDGDLSDFMASSTRLLSENAAILYPAHGAPIEDPKSRLNWLIAHRTSRETQILDALADGPATPKSLTALVYTDIKPHLLPMAERNVFAHLIDLHGKSTVTCTTSLSPTAQFTLTTPAKPAI